MSCSPAHAVLMEKGHRQHDGCGGPGWQRRSEWHAGPTTMELASSKDFPPSFLLWWLWGVMIVIVDLLLLDGPTIPQTRRTRMDTPIPTLLWWIWWLMMVDENVLVHENMDPALEQGNKYYTVLLQWQKWNQKQTKNRMNLVITIGKVLIYNFSPSRPRVVWYPEWPVWLHISLILKSGWIKESWDTDPFQSD